MMWYWGDGVHWWGWLLGAVGMVAFWAIIIWAVWYFVTAMIRRPDGRGYGSGHGPGYGPGDAKSILDERLARGEIDADEYRRLLSLIRGAGSHAGNGHSQAASGQQHDPAPH